MLLSQHLEAFQRQQETSGSHLDPLPISKNQNFCEQSELEMVSMCVNSHRRRHSPASVSQGVVVTVMTTMVGT